MIRLAPVVDKSGLDLSSIRIDGGTQSRADLNPATIEDYASALADGAKFPAVIVFYDGSDHWLADGFHRFRAHEKLGLAEIDADVRQGTRRDAILYSVGANETHGLRRTNEDKRRAVMTLLNDAEWAKWSNREIARRCGVSDMLVGSQRQDITANSCSDNRTYTTKHGTVAVMNTAAIGKPNPEQKEERDAVEATAAEEASASKKLVGPRFSVPEGENIMDLCRRGLAIEAEGENYPKVAAAIGIGEHTYRLARQIVLLADNPNLSAKDAATVRRAVEMLTTTFRVGPAYEVAEPVANRVWGEGSKIDIVNAHAKRMARFELSFGIVMQSCMTTDQVDLPYLSADQVKKALRQIGSARGALKKFADRIKEIHE